MHRFVDFARREEGTSSVEFVAVTAGVVLLAIAVVGQVQSATTASLTDIFASVQETMFGN